jgi:hypothetical protein
MVPGAVAIGRAWSHYAEPTTEIAVKQFSLPAELKNESAWVWACELSGTLWYYARKPAHKLTSTNADTRELVFRFVRERHEPQYLVNDGPSMQAVADEWFNGRKQAQGEIDLLPDSLIVSRARWCREPGGDCPFSLTNRCPPHSLMPENASSYLSRGRDPLAAAILLPWRYSSFCTPHSRRN